jgi:YesN/AraC family two-component response regulator
MKYVLIIDDERTFQLTLLDGLRTFEKDFRVMTAENGKEAKDILKVFPVDLVVTDLKMPEMDGFELLAYLRKSHPHTTVIVMTAFGNSELEQWLCSLGVHAYLEKPFDFYDLTNKIYTGLASRNKQLYN